MTKRGTAILLTAAMLCLCAAQVCAEPENATGDSAEIQTSSGAGYTEYISGREELIGKGEAVILQGETADTENAEYLSDEHVYRTNAGGSLSYTFYVPADGAYNMELCYKSVGQSSDAAEISVMIDGALPFEEAGSMFLNRLYTNDGDIRYDSDRNEFAPKTVQVDTYQTVRLYDPSGFGNDPFCFVLAKGTHTVTVKSVEQAFDLKSVSFLLPENIPDYKVCLSENKAADYRGDSVIIEGEDALYRSKKAIVPLSDNSGAGIEPQDAFKSKINYIGSNNWSRPGDTVTWEITVPESGYYTLNFSYRQNTTMNETFYRTLKIDGKIPFTEAKTVSFDYTGSWGNCVFADSDGNPYKVYLEKGKHNLSLSVTMGPLASVCGGLNDLVYELATFYRNMVMITGENPDANRDYSLFTQITDYEGKLTSYITKLDELLQDLYGITGNDSGTAPTNLRNMKDVLQRMIDNKYYAHQYKSRYYSNYAALSAWVYERTSMPLDIDAIFLNAPENSENGRHAGFFKSVAFSVKRFAASFVSRYSGEKSEKEGKSITLWINWGRDQAKVLKNLVSSDFTAKTDINVNIRITNATLLQGILSGNGPDCSIQVSRSEPVNLAMRGGLYDLSAFDDYDEVTERFMPDSDLPYEYKGGNYGIPTTQSFYMLFYRTDIFEQLGLAVPQTWDEFLNTANLLLRKNMQVGLPYVQISNMTQVNAGVGSLNIFPTLLMQKGLSLYNADGTASTLTDPETVETFVEWTSYYTKYGFPKTYDFYNRFRVGLMPMAVVSYTMYASLTAAAPEISRFWRMAPIPGVRDENGSINRSVSGSGTAAIILKDSENPELAWEFIKWWTEADTQYAYAGEVENILGTAARHDTANVEALKKLSWDRENLSALLEQWENVKEIPEVPGGYYLSRVIDQAFWNTTNGSDAYEMTAKWGKIANDEIKRKGEQYAD